MNIQVIAEHSVDMDLLPERANILDLGCRGFEFADHLINLGHRITTVDADVSVIDRYVESLRDDIVLAYLKNGKTHQHLCVAVSNFDGLVSIIRSNDPNATRVERYINDGRHPSVNLVKCVTLESLCSIIGIEFWDLIKIDVEGSEREIIMSLDRPPAKQLSIEFHEHTLLDAMETEIIVNKLVSLGYSPVQHERTKRHGLGLNYWDSLFVLK